MWIEALAWVQRFPKKERPVFIIMENVPGLPIRHPDYYDELNAYIVDLGYVWMHEVLCPRELGCSDVSRERVIWLGVLEGKLRA